MTLTQKQGNEAFIRGDKNESLMIYLPWKQALQLREKVGGSVTVLTMGPPQAEEMMRDAYNGSR